MLAVEGQIQRAEGGSIDFLAMLAWLNLHGVRDRAEILTWEWFFREIGGMRARIMEELNAPSPKDDIEPED